ncbi:unnamed protein product, partial [Mesorhabditis belari]|uniref:C2H2-type domain-containing protein n=1 Tax=Mesorhabditis belari TaxID=2138241 RepID=A0AAF3FD99_9BILA
MSKVVESWSAGPSTINAIKVDGSSTSPGNPLISPNSLVSRRRWQCTICNKMLSSKRSYDEHMNIHNNVRPHQCPDCPYAAASQMTVRRHRLRNHVEKHNWGYQCPYCQDKFMEPASYTNHVAARHPNRSCTFGCPICMWTCRCARYFKEHVEKHVVTRVWPQGDLEELYEDQLQRFLVDDEFGNGFRYLSTKESDVPKRKAESLVTQITRKEASDFFKEPLKLPKGSEEALANIKLRPERRLPVRSIILPPPPPIQLISGDTEWVGTEVTIEDTDKTGRGHIFPNGCVDGLDLD